MSNNASIGLFLTAGVVAIVLGVCMFFVLRIEIKNPEPEKKKKVVIRAGDLGEDIVLSQHGLFGAPLISVGKVHWRKWRMGPISVGARNELVLEDVVLTMSEELWKAREDATSASCNEDATSASRRGDSGTKGPRAFLTKLGLGAEHLKLERMPRFSALCIKNLSVSRLEGTNVVPWFAAREANAERSGLALEDGWSVEDGRRINWSEAMLVFDPVLQVVPRRP